MRRHHVADEPARQGADIGNLMYEYGIGVRSGRRLVVKRVDDAYFEGEV
jgi:restriction endonuclease Mrr